MWFNSILEKDLIPDSLIRRQIRKLLKQRLKEENKKNESQQKIHDMKFIATLKNSPIAVNTKEANEQHYEVPAEFYKLCLGPHLKYSSGYWKDGVESLGDAEKEMLELTCERAKLDNRQQVLELGCGWGSLSLFMAGKFPQSSFTVVSNSRTQKEYIDGQSIQRGITNLQVITEDINSLKLDQTFDRIVSVEMFEHMRNYEKLLKMVGGFLKKDGFLFVHIFVHRSFSYTFEVKDSSDWMSKYFFTGGTMPANDLLSHFNNDVTIKEQWMVNGLHYSKTAEAWLNNMDAHKKDVMKIFEKTYGEREAIKWWVYWRIFFMSCAELWSYKKGEEWFVSHYLFSKN